MTETLSANNAVYALAAEPAFTSGGRCYAACAAGLAVSDDGGHIWRDAYASLALKTPLTTAAVALSPYFERDHTVFSGALGGVLRSLDGGDSWEVATLPTPPPYVVGLAVSPNYERDGLVFAATLEDGVLRSWDRGASWAAWNFGLLDLNVYALAVSPGFARDETLIVGTESGIFRSTNGGRAWREVAFPMEYAPLLSLALSPTFETDSVLFAGTETHGIFRSVDAGMNWRSVYAWEEPRAVNQLLLGPNETGGWAMIALAGGTVCFFADSGSYPRELEVNEFREAAPTCVLAPQGVSRGAPLLIGLEDGRILVVEISASQN